MTDDELVRYALRYGGMCRDCADAFGVCPTSGLPCDVEVRQKVTLHALKAWRYGVLHGFIDDPITRKEPTDDRNGS